MVVEQIDQKRANLIFHALADGTRRDIVRRAMHREHTVSALSRHYPMSFAAVQKHVAVLERAGLVTKQRRGRERLVRSSVEALHAASRLLEQLEEVWRNRMDRFEAILVEPTEGATE